MGFIEDVEWVLGQIPDKRQIALFSATMPAEIRRIAARHLHDPAEITIEQTSAAADAIRQRYWPVSGTHKLDALTRILEAEAITAMLVFVRTKTSTLEVAEKLEARGYRSAALNGDIPQKSREQIISRLKAGKLDILVATDVAARGLDVETISHVINYDIPYDSETYVHRIGRTGRAGREGDAILFVAPREKRMLQLIEKATGKQVGLMDLPSTDMVNNRRIEKFKQRISDTLAEEDLTLFKELVTQYRQENPVDVIDIAAALAKLMQGSAPFLLTGKSAGKSIPLSDTDATGEAGRRRRERPGARGRGPEQGMERFRIEVGHRHKVKPGNIVGAIANEADIDSQYIGRIEIFDDHSLLDLPEGMPRELLGLLKKVKIGGQQMNISRLGKSAKKPAASATVREKPKIRHRDKKNKGKPKRARQKDQRKKSA